MRSIYSILLGISLLLQLDLALAQSERFYRQMFSGDLIKKPRPEIQLDPLITKRSKLVKVDINGDKLPESFVFEQTENETWINVHNKYNWRIKRLKIEALGIRSRVDKMEVRTLGPGVQVVIFYFYEGRNYYHEFLGTGRLYFMTIENGNLDNIFFKKGPIYWEEKWDGHRHYHQRNFIVDLKDFNKDNRKEIHVYNRRNDLIYFYKGKGSWLIL